MSLKKNYFIHKNEKPCIYVVIFPFKEIVKLIGEIDEG